MTAAGTRAMATADACRIVVDLAKPNTPKADRERHTRQMLARLGQPDERRARLLRDAASNARHNPDQLRRLQAARELILHPTEGSRPNSCTPATSSRLSAASTPPRRGN